MICSWFCIYFVAVWTASRSCWAHPADPLTRSKSLLLKEWICKLSRAICSNAISTTVWRTASALITGWAKESQSCFGKSLGVSMNWRSLVPRLEVWLFSRTVAGNNTCSSNTWGIWRNRTSELTILSNTVGAWNQNIKMFRFGIVFGLRCSNFEPQLDLIFFVI